MAWPRYDHGDRQPFGAWLDEERLERRRSIVLLATAAAFACVSLPSLGIVLVGVTGLDPLPLSLPRWFLLPRLLADGAIGLSVGILSGSIFRRRKWIAGSALLVTLIGIRVLAVLPYLGRTVPVSPGGAAAGQYSLQFDQQSALYLGGILVLAALGGLLSPVVFKRIRRSVLVNAAWAWTGTFLLTGALFWASFAAGYPIGFYSEWSLTDIILKCRDGIPYVVGGAWMGWALRGRPWVGAVVVGAVAAFRAVSGHIVYAVPDQLTAILQYTSLILTRTVVAGVGAWLGALLSGLRSRRELLGAAIAVVCVALAAVLIASYTNSRRTGVSAAVKPPVEDGEVVLLARGNAIAAVILTQQTLEPERVSYDWFYRTDGGSTFRVQDAGRFLSGQVSDATKIGFGPFSLGWSGHSDGSGYLYYEHFPGYPIAKDDTRICVTHRRDLERIDAFDPRWLFKASPSDPGIGLSSVSAPRSDSPPVKPDKAG